MIMSKCKECKHNDRADDCYCNQCIHQSRKDNFEPKQWKPTQKDYVPYDILEDEDKIPVFAPEFSRDNVEQVHDLVKRLKQLATLHAWACEHGYLKEYYYNGDNYFVYYNADPKIMAWQIGIHDYTHSSNTIYMSEEGAEATANALNEGVLVL